MTIVKQIEQLNIELENKGFKILHEAWDEDYENILLYKVWGITNNDLSISLICVLKNRIWYYYLTKNNIEILEIKFNKKQSINKILNTIDKIIG